jgi:Family of unknown function (DUF6065)/Cupin-like domain
MSRSVQDEEKPASPSLNERRLEVTIYQIVDDLVMKENRTDGTGWDWGWAEYQRSWMDATPNRFAYRCLPLTIANQTGLWINNPVGFTATWRGSESPGSIDFEFHAAPELWTNWITNLFGSGIITWNTPFLFRTKPVGSRLMIAGPANYFKDNAHPLTAIIESDWISMSFTMNWKIMRPRDPIRFEVGEPLFQAIPLFNNACLDLEGASVCYRKLDDDPEIARSYREWDRSRSQFQQQSKAGEIKPDAWQRDYFLGRDASGRPMAPVHMTKVKPPKVVYDGSAKPPRMPNGHAGGGQPSSKTPNQDPGEASYPMQATVENAAAASAVTQNGPSDAASARPRITDDWRRWIAENLMTYAKREDIIKRLIVEGFTDSEVNAEIELALQSPYFKGAERLTNRLKKREWLLTCYRKVSRLRPESGEIERRHKLSRGAFLNDYYTTCRPVIITGMMDDWPAMRKWSLDYFAERFGSREVDVQLNRDSNSDYELQRPKHRGKMLFSELLEKIRTLGVSNDFYITATNNSGNKDALPELWEDIVQIPEYLNAAAPQNGFFWFGPAGTITPFHHDLTNIFMAQVMGRKRVKIVPSWDLPMMRNFHNVYCEVDGRVMPAAPQPGVGHPQILECILNPGELLFLPIACLHWVEALDVSAMMSFTNFDWDRNDYASHYETFQSC